MRADRLLAILLLLQVNRRMTAGELARRLEVSERTIYRDMEALGVAGIPVIAERGAGGGWSLLEEYRTDLTGLNDSEIQALFVGQPERLLADLGLDKAAAGASIKLLAALPAMARRDAEYARQRILIDTGGWGRAAEQIATLPTLQEAIWQERRLRLAYSRGDGTQVERIVEPLGLVAKGSVWYLVAAVEGAPRTYRVSRVLAAEVLDERCARPAGFDLAAYWAESSAEFRANLPRCPVVLRADPAIVPGLQRAGRYARVEDISPRDETGWVTVQISFELEEDACAAVLSYGGQVELLEPPALREKVLRLAEAVIACYTGRDAALAR